VSANGVVVGMDFNHDRIHVALGDHSSAVLGESAADIDVDDSAADAIDAAVEMVEALRVSGGVERSQLVAAGVGVPGPIDDRTGALASAEILPGWAGLPAREALSRRLGLPVQVENDANLGALAEATLGAGRGLQHVFYLRVASGIGAGLVIGGRLFRGAAGMAGEIGHVQVRSDGVLCRCGNRGCLETVASERAILAVLRPTRGDDVTRQIIFDLLAAEDVGVSRVISDAGRAIGRVLADTCNVFNPEAVIIGGELAEAGDPLLTGIRESIDRFALPSVAQIVRVEPAELGERAEVLGALALANSRDQVP
jgi:predicted NBD/HSP70 family sugar kinase